MKMVVSSVTSSHSKNRDMRKIVVLPDVGGGTLAMDERDFIIALELLHLDPVNDREFYDQEFYDRQFLVEVRHKIGVQVTAGARLEKLDLIEEYYLIPRRLSTTRFGALDNLQDLDLSHTRLRHFPENIGNLVNLKNLLLCNSTIPALPASIGKLHSLQILDLAETRLDALPVEIGNLVNLEVLCLKYSYISSLPSSIGRLANLKLLDLSRTDISSLPPSIGHLQNLQWIYLVDLKKKLTLPEEFGNIANLESLVLRGSNISSVPPPVRHLRNLEHLDIDETNISTLPEWIETLLELRHLMFYSSGINLSDEFLLQLVKRLPKLGTLGYTRLKYGKVDHELACNRARSRMCFWTTNEKLLSMLPKLWPRTMKYAPFAFDPLPPFTRMNYTVGKPDAIYQFLVDGRESFLGLLLNPYPLAGNGVSKKRSISFISADN